MYSTAHTNHTIILSNQYATLRYYPQEKIIHHVFHRPSSGPEFRAVLDAGVDTLARNEAVKWLSDDRNNANLSEADLQWTMSEWFPRATQTGWKFWALVVPVEALARLSVAEFVDRYYEVGIKLMLFMDPDLAWRWLKER